MLDKLTLEEFLGLFGLGREPRQALALADSQETLTIATFLVGRSRYLS